MIVIYALPDFDKSKVCARKVRHVRCGMYAWHEYDISMRPVRWGRCSGPELPQHVKAAADAQTRHPGHVDWPLT